MNLASYTRSPTKPSEFARPPPFIPSLIPLSHTISMAKSRRARAKAYAKRKLKRDREEGTETAATWPHLRLDIPIGIDQVPDLFSDTTASDTQSPITPIAQFTEFTAEKAPQKIMAHELQSLVRALNVGSSDSEDAIIQFSCRVRDAPSQSGTDCTSAVLQGLQYGLNKYGYDMNVGSRFFAALKRIVRSCPTSLTIDSATPPALGSVAGVGFDVIPRAYVTTHSPPDGLTQAMSVVRRELRGMELSSPTGLTALKFGFSENFAITAVSVITSDAIPGFLRLSTTSRSVPSTTAIPIVILRGSFEDLATSPIAHGPVDTIAAFADTMINGNLTGIALKQRHDQLQSLRSPVRAPLAPGPIVHGSSIGLASGGESKGSVAVFLRPTTSSDLYSKDSKYVLTAGHVVKPENIPASFDLPFSDDVEQIPRGAFITTPGRLDIVKLLHGMQACNELETPKAQYLVQAWSTNCGIVEGGRIGVDVAGFREDWALIKLEPTYDGNNGIWWNLPASLTQMLQTSEGFRGPVTGSKDPKVGEIWNKEGSATGWTSGKMSGTDVEIFLKGTTLPVNPDSVADGDVHPSNCLEARLNLFVSIEQTTMAAKGDSGAALYGVPSDCATGMLMFGGLVVSVFVPYDHREGPSLVMTVPQSRLFSQLKQETGLEWSLA
ncbi:hypothetical protein FN846DRAFT_922774 [Sphaerosporella brunnea]|uniref:Uncharacterized protein n=1 Tax=Sphaerosporella brunnea TaxID=1250544 RepID=A0A5J5EI11_9PEZI|nr:hypothetical protein FN846DRAFT_922774 [Sphaerosporella brunnea]